MNKYKRIFAVFMLLIFTATRPSIAHAADIPSDSGDYTAVKEGERVPYSGYLFNTQGLIKVMVNKSLEIQQLTINKDSEIKKLNIEIEMLKKQHDLELKLAKELSDNMMGIKDNRIKLLEDSHKWDDVKLFGALMLGIVLSVTIFFAAVQITNNIKITTTP
jgi:hypothetical protein